ncbi:MAG: hypothetical protein H6581_01045 [Bacteroidia bacterium]|nr:hypothetical protein [Bacteroidia bacterium]
MNSIIEDMLHSNKLRFLLILLVSFLGKGLFAAEQITLLKAVENHLINIKVRGTDWSDHEDYARASVVIQVENKSGGAIDLLIPAGQRFLTVEKEFQDMLVTQEVILALAPGGRKQAGLIACCTQLHNMGPGSGTDFTVGPMAEGHLLKIATYINEHHLYGSGESQQAVWVISDGSPINYVYDAPMQKYLSEVTGLEITERSRGMNRPTRIATFTVKGRVEWALNEPSQVSIAMYDSTGTLVKSIIDESQQRGRHWHSWLFTQREGTYTMRLTVNGVVKGEDKYVLKRS